MEPFATLSDLQDGLEWDLSPEEERLAAASLDEASDLIRIYGRNWTPQNRPDFIKRLTIKIVARFLRNPDAYTQSRAGDETLNWSEVGAEHIGIYLTKEEQKLVRRLCRTDAVVSVPVIAHGTVKRPTNIYVPVDGGDPFPMGALSPSEEPAWPEPYVGFTTDAIMSRPL